MRFIFTACSGRTGTAYLASLFTLIPNLGVAHEGPPVLPMRSSSQWEVGMNNALNFMNAVPGVSTFALISHSFLKAGPEWWLEHHPETDVIVLTRPVREIALSAWRHFSISDRTKLGYSTKLSPYADDLRYPIRNPEELTDYSLCYWHALEMEARQKEVAALYTAAGRTVHTLSMSELVDWRAGHFQRLLRVLELPQVPYFAYRVMAKNKINSMSANSEMCRAIPPNIQNFEAAVIERRTE